MSSVLNKAPKSISPSFRARLYLPCPIICLASLRFAYTLPVGTCLTLVSILWCFNGFPQIRIQVLDNTKSGHFSHEKATPQGGNYSFEICDLDGSGSISCIDHNRSIPSNKRFENTTVRGTQKRTEKSVLFWCPCLRLIGERTPGLILPNTWRCPRASPFLRRSQSSNPRRRPHCPQGSS